MREYKVIRSKRKTVSLCIDKNLNITVRAPYFVSRKAIDDFVQQKEDWIQTAFKD